MFNKYYKIRVSGKNLRRFIKSLHNYGIKLNSISLSNSFFTAIVDKSSLDKLLDLKTYYKIEVLDGLGMLYLKKLILSNICFIIFFFIGILYLYFLSNVIFYVVIVSNDFELNEKVYNELDNYNIKKYKFIKDYDDIQSIKKNILNKYKNNIEWIEIERIGTKYYVKLEKRVINEIKKDLINRHVVAKKDGIIKKIVASNGEVVKKVDDYVNKGDILISGEIHKKDEVKGNTAASGNVYAEVWYKVNVILPINYYEKKYTGNSKNVFNISFLDINFNIFDNNKYSNKDVTSFSIYDDFYNMFKISYNKEKEFIVNEDINLITNESIAVNRAKEKILSKLGKNEYIIYQKKLKTILNDSTIRVEVFFKVYEDISQYKYYLNEGV